MKNVKNANIYSFVVEDVMQKNRMADKKGEKCDDFPIRLRSVARKVYSDLKGF